MKQYIFLLSVCELFFVLIPLRGDAQFTHKIKADSVRIYNDNCTAELIVENSTSNIGGFLFNKGGGRTEFRRAVIQLNDSSFLIGGDTLKIKPVFNDLDVGSVLFYDGIVISQDNNNFFWDNVNKRLGVGTKTPQGVFESVGVSYFTRSGQSLLLNPNYSGANTHAQLQVIGNMALAFATNGDTERGRITSTGRWLFGTTTDDGTSIGQFNGNVYTSQGFLLENGKYLSAKRNSDGVYVDLLGILAGTDDTRLITSGTFRLRNTGTIDLLTINSGSGIATFSNMIRSVGYTAPTSGTGLELSYYPANNSSYILSYDRTNSEYKDLNINDLITIKRVGTTGVGVNTQSPAGLLHIAGANAGSFFDAGYSNTLNGQPEYAADGGILGINFVGYAAGTSYFRDFYVYNGKQTPIMYLRGSTGAATFTGIGIFGTRNGTVPTYRGDLIINQSSSTLSSNGGIELFADGAGSGYGWRTQVVFDGGSGYNYSFQSRSNSTSWAEKMVITPLGNLGIGTPAPNSVFHIIQPLLPRITLTKSGTISWYLGNSNQGSSNNFSIGTDSGGNTELFTLLNTGNAIFNHGNVAIQSTPIVYYYSGSNRPGLRIGEHTHLFTLPNASTYIGNNLYFDNGWGTTQNGFGNGIEMNYTTGAVSFIRSPNNVAGANNPVTMMVINQPLTGSGNGIVGADNGGNLFKMAIGSGLSFDGTTLTATSNSAVTGTGTTDYLPLWNSTNGLGNSVITQSSGNIYTTGEFNADGQGRFKGWHAAGAGLALEVGVSGGTGNVISYNRTTSAYATLNLGGYDVNLVANGGGLNFTGAAAFNSTLSTNGDIINNTGTSGATWTRYSGGNNLYASSLTWNAFQLGNNGPNYIVAGHNIAGGDLRFYVNNTNRVTNGIGSDGILALHLQSTGDVLFNKSVTTGYGFYSNIRNDNLLTGSAPTDLANGFNFIGASDYWGIRTTSSNEFKLDVYNFGSPKTALTIEQNGVSTFTNYINVNGGAINLKGAASNTIGAGGYYYWQNTTTLNADVALQLNASNGLDMWFYQSDWQKKITFSTSGDGIFKGALSAANAWTLTSSNSPYIGSAVLLSSSGYNAFIAVDGAIGSKYFGMKTDGTFYVAGGSATFNGSVNATSFFGAGTGLTGTANNLSIGGNAATATTASQWDGTSHSFGSGQNSTGLTEGIIGMTGSGVVYRYNAIAVQTFLGLNTAAYKQANQDLNTTSSVTFNTIDANLIRSTGDIVAFYSSDIRLKKDIKPISNALSLIEKIHGYSYVWDETKQDTHKGKDYGVIAQEVEQILPELVKTRENGYKAVDYPKLTALLIQAINELKEEFQKLRK